MRLPLLALLVVSLAGSTATHAQTGPTRYWIVLSETVPAAPPASAVPRRALRGTGAPTDRALAPEARAALDALGVTPVVESLWLGALSADLTAEQIGPVAALPFVHEVRPVGRFTTTEPLAAPEVPSILAPWRLGLDAGPSAVQLASVGADDLLAAGYDGTGVTIGFLDTLFDFDHPALAHVASGGRLLGVADFTGGLPQTSFHGLSVTSVALGGADGMLLGPARGARVLAATTEYAPTETHAEEDALVAGLEWLEAQGADVVNISLGYSTFDPGEGDYTYADMDGDTAIVTRAVDRAASRGLIVVTSAGNEGSSAWQYVTAPADADSVITVGAATPSGDWASFSSQGPTADGRTKPDVVAQGTEMVVAQPGGAYATFGSGTSFSAPLAAGVVAQILQARPSLTPIGMRDLLRATASQSASPDNFLGWGLIDGPAALALATALDDGPPEARWEIAPVPVRAGAHLVVDTPGPLALDVLDALGRRVAEIAPGAGGRRTVRAPSLPPGVYFAVPADRSLPARRLVIVR